MGLINRENMGDIKGRSRKGQLMLAKFPNDAGLERIGENLFQQSNNSGTMDKNGDGIQLEEMFRPGENGAAAIISGTLEMSNVDLSEEFTEMITAQRGFQANTRIITTSDEILQELVNLKR
jgi:flagellar hook protein FlgE